MSKFFSNVNSLLHKKQISPLTLKHKDIRVYPTKAGFFYGICAVCLFILGINYQNNLIIILCCLQLAAIPYILLDCYKNIKGITFQSIDTDRFFVGQSVRFKLLIKTEKPIYSLKITSISNNGIEEFYDEVNDGDEIGITFHPQERGYFKCGGYAITTLFPLGIFCAHCVIDFDQTTLIYPKTLTGNYRLTDIEQNGKTDKIESISTTNIRGMDELSGLRPYREGEPLSLIAWKQLACQKGLMSKDFTANIGEEEYLDIDQFYGTVEEKISVMTYAVVQLNNNNIPFGLKLGYDITKPNNGNEHYIRSLEKLALYGK